LTWKEPLLGMTRYFVSPTAAQTHLAEDGRIQQTPNMQSFAAIAMHNASLPSLLVMGRSQLV